MTLRGWRLDRQQFPPSLHLTVTHAHAKVAGQFLDDPEQAMAKVKRFSFNKLVDSLKVGLVQAGVVGQPKSDGPAIYWRWAV